MVRIEGFGTRDWTTLNSSKLIPPERSLVGVRIVGGAGFPEKPGVTWFDDLRIYQDDVLIYANNFSNWAPAIIPAQIITGVAMIKYLK